MLHHIESDNNSSVQYIKSLVSGQYRGHANVKMSELVDIYYLPASVREQFLCKDFEYTSRTYNIEP